ncbi:MAG: hypothetical protein J0L76_07570 [Rhodobacterales bacterium]|nr:hypothetical protein [Rhodobacterales bacterium]
MSFARAVLTMGLSLGASTAEAEQRDGTFVVDDQMVMISVVGSGEVMTTGPNAGDQTQVLSGPDIEILGFTEDEVSIDLLGIPALVAVVPGTHTCEGASGNPVAYYVVWWSPAVTTDGPLTTCADLSLSFTNGAILLEEDPMGDGEFWSWAPARGFAEGVTEGAP